jgi:siroheme synthase-like protein
MFPLVVDLRGRRVVVIGAGRVGTDKAQQLLDAGALVTVISKELLAPLPAGVDVVIARAYEFGDLEGALLAVAATGDATVNDAIVREANERNVLLNVVDDVGRSAFYFTANYRDGEVLVSVSTGGASPALAQWVRNKVASALPRNLASVASRLRAERTSLHTAGESTENRPWMQRVEQLVEEL